jgi:hypothetical protein
MSDFLKGNFETEKKVTAETKKKETLEERFEREAMKHIGGSMVYVSKKKVVWDADSDK